MAAAMWHAGGADSEILKHVESSHITKALDYGDSAHQRFSDDRRDGRRTKLIALCSVLATGLIAMAMLVFSGNAPILEAHMDAIFALLAGGVGGFGVGARYG